MSIIQPIPLYPSHNALASFDINDYPELKAFLQDNNEFPWIQTHWQWGFDFLLYIGRNKSEHTFIRFRNEVERFLLWVFFFKKEPVDSYRKNAILDYVDFCWQPPVGWISTANFDRFIYNDGYFRFNPKWLPYRLNLPKSQVIKADKKKYRPSQQTLIATFTAITAFYNYLINEELCFANPAQSAKKDCRYFVADTQVKKVRRLSEQQWQYVLDIAVELANDDKSYERSLFIIAALKTLFLRISELSERKDWSPIMSHFWEDENQNWWLKIYGKGRKLRDTTVPPDFLPFLQRYRESRDLSPLPYAGDNACLVEKIRGRGGMSARHLTRLVQEIFNHAYDKMKTHEGEQAARKLKEASTHWLRHTGASMEIERGRALKDLSEDLGHASMATTDTVYVQTENKKRAQSGKIRTVD